jgi:hypothetical protein
LIKRLRIKIKNQNIESQALIYIYIYIELKGKIEKKNHIHKRIQNKENKFSTNSMMIDEILKNNRNQPNLTFRICKTDHEAGS